MLPHPDTVCILEAMDHRQTLAEAAREHRIDGARRTIDANPIRAATVRCRLQSAIAGLGRVRPRAWRAAVDKKRRNGRNAMRKPATWAASALAMVVLGGGPALAETRVGTDGSDVLVGTHRADQIEGKGGDDVLKGLAGNDVYVFANGWGEDTLEEKALYRVGGKRRPGGVDTLDFSAVTGSGVDVVLGPSGLEGANAATGPAGEMLKLGTSRVENVIGTQGKTDKLVGGVGKNTLQTGGGLDDILVDLGGYHDGPQGRPEVPASDDAYLGAGQNTGHVFVQDHGGSGDVLDLRPIVLEDAHLARIDMDRNETRETLQIVTGPDTQVLVGGYFGAFQGMSDGQGRVEKLVFADGTFSASSEVARAMDASVSTTATGSKQAELAAAAEVLADEARRRFAEDGPLLR